MNARALTVGTVTAVAAASAALLAYLLFTSQRNLVTTGDAHLQRWVSPGAARWIYLAIAVALLTAFVATAVLGTRPAPPAAGVTLPAAAGGGLPDVAGEGGSGGELSGVTGGGAVDERSWRIGAVAGAAVGLVLGLATLAAGAIARTAGPLTVPVAATYLAVLAGAPLVGGRAARSTGRAGSGALAGLWYGLLLALLAGFALVARDALFAHRLTAGAWLLDRFDDPACNHTAGATLRACEIGDSLGAMASQWLMFPLAGAGLAALGGLAGKAATRTRLPGPGWRRPPVLAPLGLSAVLLVVFAAEITFQLW